MANTISLSQILQSRPAVCPTIYGYILPGVPDHNGYIKVGYDASITILNDDYSVASCFVEGIKQF